MEEGEVIKGMIYNFIAYDIDKNLGRAYNKCMSLLDDDDWAVFLDHDAMFMQRDWYKEVSNTIKNNPSYGLFTCSTNRIGCPWQLVNGVDKDNHNIKYHKLVGKELEKNKNIVIDVTHSTVLLSGVVIIVSKKTWTTITGAKDGFLGVDNDLHYKCRKNNIKVGFIPNIYTYHWYRGDGDISHLN